MYMYCTRRFLGEEFILPNGGDLFDIIFSALLKLLNSSLASYIGVHTTAFNKERFTIMEFVKYFFQAKLPNTSHQ